MITTLKQCLITTTIILSSNLQISNASNSISEDNLQYCHSIGLTKCPQPFDKTIPQPAKMLEWNQQERIIGFRNTYRMYQGDVFSTNTKQVTSLSKAPYSLPPINYRIENKNYSLDDYLQHQSVTGLLILKKGQIVYEYYGQGNSPTTLWTSRSVAKSIVSILTGIAIQEGFIKSVNDPIVNYIPELRDSAWKEVTLHQLLQHTSGIEWNEDYTDPNSDFARLTRCEATKYPLHCVFDLIKTCPSKAKPGKIWSYNTGGAWLVGLILERATNMPIAKYLESRLWNQYPMEQQGIWETLQKNKVDMGGHGFNATLRDWGRFGLFVSHQGLLPNGKKLLPDNWIKESTTWTTAKNSVNEANPEGQYGYQWWHNGINPKAKIEPKTTNTSNQTFWALGIFGQTIAINPVEDLIMVQWSTWKDAVPLNNLNYEQPAFFNAVSNVLSNK